MKDYLEVIKVEVIDSENLRIEFNDGEKKTVNFSHLISSPPPVFEKIKDENEFRKVSINPVGGISWEFGGDLSAEYLKAS